MRKLAILMLVFLLTIGILFRFVNIEQKPVWGDEADSLSWISGRSDFKKIALQGQAMSVEEVLSYQNPYPKTNLVDTYKSIYYEHAPLYYLLARVWMESHISNLFTARSLAVLMSLLIFPCIYWLCLELFSSSLIGWMAIAIVGISPFHLLYAQEARQYTLWITLILLSSLTLLRAIRLKTNLSWIAYTVTLTLMLYTHVLSILVIFIYSIYIFLQEGLHLSKILIAYLLSSLISLVLFIPWMIVIASNLQGNGDYSPAWSKEPTPLISLIKTWILHFTRLFWDFNQNFEYKNLIFYFLTLGLIIYAIYFMCVHTQKRTWLFLILFMIIPFILLATPDIVLGGRRSTPIRYFIPSCLAIEITVAYLLSTQIFLFTKLESLQSKFWQITTVTLLCLGIVSCGFIIREDTWWTKQREYYHLSVSTIVNQAKHPLVIAPWFDMRSLAHSLSPNVTLQDIRLREDISSVGHGFSDIFVYQYQETLEKLLEKQPNLKVKETYYWSRTTTPVNTTATKLWKLTTR